MRGATVIYEGACFRTLFLNINYNSPVTLLLTKSINLVEKAKIFHFVVACG